MTNLRSSTNTDYIGITDTKFRGRNSDRLWTVYIFVISVLLTSFPIRSSSLWIQLHDGREFLSGQLQGVQSEWLFSVGCYLLYSLGGGTLLVAVKAVAFGVLGVTLAWIGRCAGSGWLVSTFCAGMAVLASSIAAQVLPISVSLVSLGIMMWFVRERSVNSPLRIWPLVILFLIWGNADRGVVTGLLVFVCFWAGRAFDVRSGRVQKGFGWRPLVVIGAGLLSLVHFQGMFPLPAELGWLTNWISTRSPNVISILGPATDYPTPLNRSYAELYLDTPARLAYYPLLLVGAIAFVVNYRGLRWQRLLPWLLTGILSVISDRAVPVFAVISGPILALNLNDVLSRSNRQIRRPIWMIPIAVFGVTFLLAAWPGWLQGTPYEPRRWGAEIPNSPQLACERLQEFRGSERFTAGTRTLHLNAESAKIFAWFDPEDDGVFDPDLARRIARAESPDLLKQRMQEGRFTRIVVYHPNTETVRDHLRSLLYLPRIYPLLFVRGGVAVFGWNDPGTSSLVSGPDLTDPWFDLREENRAVVPTGRYRTKSAADLGWYEQVKEWFTTPTQSPSIHRDEAALLLLMSNVSRDFIPLRNQDSWPIEQWVGLIGSAAMYSNPIAADLDATLRVASLLTPGEPSPPLPALTDGINRQFQSAQMAKPDCLTGPLFASIRAARRAIDAAPNEPSAHLILAEAYLNVMTSSHYRAWASPDRFRKAADLLQAQTVAAYHRGLSLSRKPPYQSNKQLAELYYQIGYLDLPLKHLKDARLGRQAIAYELARRNQEDREGQSLNTLIERLEKAVSEQQALLESETKKALVIDRARAAYSLKLQGKALELLLKSDVSAFGAEGTNLQLNLFLRTGRADDVIDWTAPVTTEAGQTQSPVRDVLGTQTYHWYRGQALAASGASNEADVELANIEGGVDALVPDPKFLGQRAAIIAAEKVLVECPKVLGAPDSIGRITLQTQYDKQLSDLQRQLVDMAEVCVLRAILAAESGDLGRMKSLCQAVLEFSPLKTGRVEDPLRKIANEFLHKLAEHERVTRTE